MRPVTHDYQSLNEYTLPLQGKPYYRSSGIIYAVDRNGNKYAVGRVDLERFDDQNFQYVFTPEWSVIDTLPSSIFQGKQRHQEGVAQAKNSGKYAGRKRIVVDPNLFRQVAEDFRNHKVTEEEAMHRAGISSRSTFYRRLKEI